MPARGQRRRRSTGPGRDATFEYRIRSRYDLGEFAYRATLEALKNIGAYVRRVARNNARKRKRSGEPGDVWSSHKGTPLKKAIMFGVNREKLYAVVGPKTHNPKSPSNTAPHALEYGGVTVMQARVYTERGLRAKQERQRRARSRRRRRKSLSPRQLAAMRERLASTPGGEKPIERVSARKVTYTYRMRPRPAMYIALMMSAPYVPNSMKYAFARTRPGASQYFGPDGVPIGRFAGRLWRSRRRRFG